MERGWAGGVHPRFCFLLRKQNMADTETSDLPPIFIVTADRVAATGRITWKYMFAEGMPKPFQNQLIGLPWGYAWDPNPREPGDISFNIFRSGQGLLLGGGWTVDDSEAWAKQMVDAIPAASLLMTTEVFEWLRVNVLEKFGRKYERFHCSEILATS